MRAKANRKRRVRRQLPQLPKIRLRVNWRALLWPPLIVGALSAAAFAGERLLDRPLEHLIVQGPFQRVSAVQVEAALAGGLKKGFLTLDLSALRRRVRALDWVDQVEIGRVWPDSLIVRVTEHRAAARWGKSGLLDVHGELFTQHARHDYPELPKLDGPAGSEADVAAMYLKLRGRLEDAHLRLTSLRLDERGAWHFELAGGQRIRLGRNDVQARLERFFDVVAPALGDRLARVDYVDMRYTNGFAVGWLDSAPTELARNMESSNRG